MSKYRQDAEILLPDVTPCGDDLLSTLSYHFTPKKEQVRICKIATGPM